MKDKIFYVCLGVFIIAWFAIFSTIEIEGNSMYPTFNDGDFCIVWRHSKVERGDVVAIYSEDFKKILYKRVIGVGGDTVEISNGYVYVNGESLEESYINGATEGSLYEEVPVGKLFVMGDNRPGSADSRHVGSLNEKDVKGVFLLNLTKITKMGRPELLSVIICIWLICFVVSFITRNKKGALAK